MFHRTRVLALLCLAAPAVASAQAQPIAFEDASAAIPFRSESLQSGGTGVVGAVWLDYDGDGRDDLFLPNGAGRSNALYRNNGDGTYTNLGADLGLDRLPWGWGNAMRDFDNDGHLDLFFAGALPNFFAPPTYYGAGGEANYGVLWSNDGDGTWTDVSATLAHDFRHDFSSGVAAGDYDGDGYEDLAVMVTYLPPFSTSGQPVLLRNRGGENRWLKLRAAGTVSNRDGVGARVTVRAGDLVQLQEIYAGSSLASQHSQTLTFGLGSRPQATVDVLWPSGFRNRLYDVDAGTTIELPEIPCSFDAPAVAFPDYQQCVLGALDRLREAGIVAPEQTGRLLSSALRAYHETH
ncbi:MAG: CRTAC1 family protein [Thermoanaerobaculia bacterium]